MWRYREFNKIKVNQELVTVLPHTQKNQGNGDAHKMEINGAILGRF